MKQYEIIIIGGGLAGLCSAIQLARAGSAVCVIERNSYPHHKVCGEYVSNEVTGYLQQLGVDPFEHGAVAIDELHWSTPDGKSITAPLPLGGFGMSRYTLDQLLYQQASNYCEITQDTVTEITFKTDTFHVETQSGVLYTATYVIGAYGKRSILDKKLKRPFIENRTSWMAVKGHYEYDFPSNRVGLHSFYGGYCGLSKTEKGHINACYLATVPSFKKAGNLETHREDIVGSNPILRHFFTEADPLFANPLTISQISFESKSPVENHVFMIGDSAGLIHPLCGNGMAMAIHGAKLFCDLYHDAKRSNDSREALEKQYKKCWSKTFSRRLRVGSWMQSLLLRPRWAAMGFQLAQRSPTLLKKVISQTHGTPIV